MLLPIHVLLLRMPLLAHLLQILVVLWQMLPRALLLLVPLTVHLVRLMRLRLMLLLSQAVSWEVGVLS